MILFNLNNPNRGGRGGGGQYTDCDWLECNIEVCIKNDHKMLETP